MKTLLARFRVVLILWVFAASLLSGCGSSSTDFLVQPEGRPAPGTTGSVQFRFVRAQSAITVPNGTVSLRFEFFNQAGGQGQLTLTTSRTFSSEITIDDVPVATQSVVITALGPDGEPLAQGQVALSLVAGGSIAVDGAGVVLTPVTLDELAVSPTGASVLVGGTQQFTATATFSNGDSLSLPADWTVTGPATVAATTGLATGTQPGQATITATRDEVSDSVTLTVLSDQDDQPPLAQDDSYDGLGNAPLNVSAANGVLANDISSQPMTATLVSPPSTGELTLNPNGSFLFEAPAGFRGLVTFVYSADNDLGSSEATVTLDLQQSLFFVDNTAAAGGDGSLESPFSSLTQLLGLDQAGDTIFVFAGEGTYGGYSMLDNQRLVGEASGLTVAGSEVVPPGDRPAIGFVAPASGSEIAGFQINNGVDINGRNGFSLVDCVMVGPSTPVLNLVEASGPVLVRDCEFRTSTNAIRVTPPLFSNLQFQLLDTTMESTNVGNGTGCLIQGPARGVTFEASGNSFIDLNFGIHLVTGGESNLSFSVTGNSFENLQEAGIILQTQSTSIINLDISENEFDTVPRPLWALDSGVPYTLDLTFAQNVLSQCNAVEIDLANGFGLSGALRILGNTFSDSLGGVRILNSGDLPFRIDDNSIEGTGSGIVVGPFSVDSAGFGLIRGNMVDVANNGIVVNIAPVTGSEFCLALANNTVNTLFEITNGNAGMAEFTLEDSLSTNTPAPTTVGFTLPADLVPVGTCPEL